VPGLHWVERWWSRHRCPLLLLLPITTHPHPLEVQSLPLSCTCQQPLFAHVTQSHRHTATLSHCHTVSLSHRLTVALLHCYTVNLSHFYTVTLSHRLTVPLFHCSTVALLHGHTCLLVFFLPIPFLIPLFPLYTAAKPTGGSKVVDYVQHIKSLAAQLFRGGPFDSLDEEDWFTGQPLALSTDDDAYLASFQHGQSHARK
jgi:hypothetical protein